MKKQFSLSGALIVENLKMLWFIPVLMFLGLFFLLPFQILTIGQTNMEGLSYYITNFLKGWNVGLVAFNIVFPLVAACTVMNYYHKPEMAFTLSTQPFSRQRLFNSQIVSGWIMIFVPILLTAVILFTIKGIAVVNADEFGETAYDLEDIAVSNAIYGIKDIISWIVTCTSLVTFFYGIYILAGSITGTTIVQVLGSLVLWGALPALILMIQTYLEQFYLGYSSYPAWIEDLMVYSNPVIHMLVHSNENANDGIWCYFFGGLILLAISKFAISKAKFEHVGDGMIFSLVEEASTWLVALVCGLASGLLFMLVETTFTMTIIGVIVGSIISFAVTKIIIARSIKIFNKKNIKSCSLFLIVVFILTLILTNDLFGFAKRVPDEKNVEAVIIDDMFTSVASFYDYDDYGKTNNITDEETIKATIALNRYIVDNELYYSCDTCDFIEYYPGYNEKTEKGIAQGDYDEYVYFKYILKNGNMFEREFLYRVDMNTVELANEIVTQKAYKESHMLKNGLADKKDISLSFDVSYSLYTDNPEEEFSEYISSEYVNFDIKPMDIDTVVEAYDDDVIKSDYYGANSSVMKFNNEVLGEEGPTSDGQWRKYDYASLTLYFTNKDGERCSNVIQLPFDSSCLMKKLDELGYLSKEFPIE